MDPCCNDTILFEFFYYVPEFQCTSQQMQGYDTCEDYVCSVQSEQFWLDHMKGQLPKSISLDYGVIMVCSQEWISSLLQSMSYIGSFFGFIIMPSIADNKGRKISEFMSWNIAVFGCVILLISMNLYFVGIGSFLMGFGANSAITLHYSFIKELVISKLSQRMIIFLQVSFSFGIFLIAFISSFISDWKYILGFFITLPSLLIILARNRIQQTPQFSLIQSKNSLLNSLNRIAVQNKAKQLTEQDLTEANLSSDKSKNIIDLTFYDLFRYKSLLKLTIICGSINFIIEFTYDGTILSLGKIGINVFLDQMLVGLVEISAAIFASYIVAKVYRKTYCRNSFILITSCTMLLGTLSLLKSQSEQDQLNAIQIIQMIILALLRIVLNSVWGVFFVFIAELFPAQITSLSFGWMSIVGTIGASISPFIRLATAQFTLYLMAVLAMVGFVLIQTLNQTKDKPIRFKIKQRQFNTREIRQMYLLLVKIDSYIFIR